MCWPKLFCSCSSFSLYFECAMFGSVFVLSIVAHAMFWAEQRHRASKSQLSAARARGAHDDVRHPPPLPLHDGRARRAAVAPPNSVPVISGATAAGPAATTALTVERPAACLCPTAPAPPRCERCRRCGVRVSRRRMAALLVVLALASVGLCALLIQRPHAGGRRAIFARRPTIARDVVRDLARLAESLGRPTHAAPRAAPRRRAAAPHPPRRLPPPPRPLLARLPRRARAPPLRARARRGRGGGGGCGGGRVSIYFTASVLAY